MSICGLCGGNKLLLDSHLIPKSMYKKLRDDSVDKRVIRTNVDTMTAHYSDHQVSTKFLCKDCEDRFNKYGEKFVSNDCYDSNKNKFQLLDKINSSKEITIINGTRYINPYDNINILDPEKYLYFAASVFWRSSAWPRRREADKDALGSKYQEQFRKYLLKENPFSEKAHLFVFVDTDKEILPIIMFPKSKNCNGFHKHIFSIPGIHFNLDVGNKGKEWQRLSKNTGSQILFAEYSFNKSDIFNETVRSMQNDFRATGKLAMDSFLIVHSL